MEGDTFTCYVCQEVFTKIRSDDEALEEARETFGDKVDEGDNETLCDDCFQNFMKWRLLHNHN